MTTVTANVERVSGPGVIGFGIDFCYQDENNHYLLMITTEGRYTMAKRVDGTYSSLFAENWYSSGFLFTGADTINTISITHDGSGHFDVRFNGLDITHFDDVDNLRGGSAGPSIGIGASGDENFPAVPEDGRFMMTAPVVYPLESSRPRELSALPADNRSTRLSRIVIARSDA